MASFDKVSVLPPAAATLSTSRAQDPSLTDAPSDASNQDEILENLMNEFLAEEAKSQPIPPPLGTNHAVEKVEADPEEVLRQCLETFNLEEDNEPIDSQQMLQMSMKAVNLQLEMSNKLFAQIVAQPKDSLATWLTTQDKKTIQALFLGGQQTKTMFELGGALIKPMISQNILQEWTVNYPLALLRIKEQPELQSYIPNAEEEQELMSQMFSHCSDATAGQAKAYLEKDMKAATQFFDKFLAIQDDEQAKAWLTEQQNKKDPQDPECYFYPFSKVGQLVEALDQKPNIKEKLDQDLLKRCIGSFSACLKRLKTLGLEQVLNEMDPQTQEKMQKEYESILSFFKDLLPRLQKETDPQQIKKWIEAQNSFKYLPFLVAKSAIIINYENVPREFHPLAKEFGELFKECLPFIKKLGLESYLKMDPKFPPPGLTQEQIEKFNSREL